MAVSIMLDVRNRNGARIGIQPAAGNPGEMVIQMFERSRVPGIHMVQVPGVGIFTEQGEGSGRYSWLEGSEFVTGTAADVIARCARS